jgi:hypothetical protein
MLDAIWRNQGKLVHELEGRIEAISNREKLLFSALTFHDSLNGQVKLLAEDIVVILF